MALPGSPGPIDYHVWIAANCRFISPKGSEISIVTSKGTLGSMKVIVVRTLGGQREALLSESAETVLKALELLHSKAAESVDNHITAHGFAFAPELRKRERRGKASIDHVWRDESDESDSEEDDSASNASDLASTYESLSDDETVSIGSERISRHRRHRSSRKSSSGKSRDKDRKVCNKQHHDRHHRMSSRNRRARSPSVSGSSSSGSGDSSSDSDATRTAERPAHAHRSSAPIRLFPPIRRPNTAPSTGLPPPHLRGGWAGPPVPPLGHRPTPRPQASPMPAPLSSQHANGAPRSAPAPTGMVGPLPTGNVNAVSFNGPNFNPRPQQLQSQQRLYDVLLTIRVAGRPGEQRVLESLKPSQQAIRSSALTFVRANSALFNLTEGVRFPLRAFIKQASFGQGGPFVIGQQAADDLSKLFATMAVGDRPGQGSSGGSEAIPRFEIEVASLPGMSLPFPPPPPPPPSTVVSASEGHAR